MPRTSTRPRGAGLGPLYITLPIGNVELSRLDAEMLTVALRSFGPADEMPSAHSAAEKLSRILTEQAGESEISGPEMYEILLAIDRTADAGAASSTELKSLRHLLALQLAWHAQQHRAGRAPSAATDDRT